MNKIQKRKLKTLLKRQWRKRNKVQVSLLLHLLKEIVVENRYLLQGKYLLNCLF